MTYTTHAIPILVIYAAIMLAVGLDLYTATLTAGTLAVITLIVLALIDMRRSAP